MKVIITKIFQQNFDKDFKKYNFDLNTFVEVLKKTKQITLKSPYFKIKIFLDWVSIRWISMINDIWNIIPIFIVLKKDKKIWENIILNKIVLEKIDTLMSKMIKDFNKWDYMSY